MGWCVENLKIPFGTKLNENNGNEYLDACENTGPKRTLKDYLKIQKGDFVVMRAKSAYCYIGNCYCSIFL